MKQVILGVSAGIAAYKACDVLRELQRSGCEVRVVMTERARSFVGPLTFAALTGHPVVTDVLDDEASWDFQHIRLARTADLFLVCPCTADVIGKLAGGIADDFLTTFFTATEAPTLLAPAMNAVMWAHAPVRRNVEMLRGMGVRFVGPAEGDLACGETGAGRLAPVDDIVEACLEILGRPRGLGRLAGRRVLITAGPTAEDIDPVRTLTNRSSGRMGFAMAREARERGAQVVLVHGPVSLEPPEGVEVLAIRSAREMRERVLERLAETQVLVGAAAVADYRPEECATNKLKKSAGEEERSVRLVRNPDILSDAAAAGGREGRLHVGFAVETEDLATNARRKLQAKDLDLIVANDASAMGGTDGELVIFDRDGEVLRAGPAGKDALARAVWDAVEASLREPSS